MPRKKAASQPRSLLTLVGLVVFLAALAWVFTKQIPFQPSPKLETESSAESTSRSYLTDPIDLPAPAKSSRTSIEAALNSRRSRRTFLDQSLNLKQVSQLLWALQGVTASDWGGRTTPSAKSAYPLEIYLVANQVDDLDPGIYHYIPGDLEPVHQLGQVKAGDFSAAIAEAAQQSSSQNAAAIFLIAANFQKMYDKFDGKKVDKNVYLEAGHAAENLYLQVESLGLGTVVTGGFDPAKTAEVISLPKNETLIYLIPVGHPQE